ncbi:MAG: CoA-binding protein, partial [Candidatus Bathyarchaeia archaeon]
MGIQNLDKFFNPKRVAIIGASDKPNSVGAKIFKNLVGVGYSGAVFPVNPFKTTIQGITAYPSITKIPWQIDLAIIATPAHTVPQIIDECGKANVPAAIIISAGFNEASIEGQALEKQVRQLRSHYGMRII